MLLVAYARTWYVVFAVSPDRGVVHGPPLVKPSVVCVLAVVGFALVLHAIPLAVIASPPSVVMVPPLEAAVEVISITGSVTTTGAVTLGLIVTVRTGQLVDQLPRESCTRRYIGIVPATDVVRLKLDAVERTMPEVQLPTRHS